LAFQSFCLQDLTLAQEVNEHQRGGCATQYFWEQAKDQVEPYSYNKSTGCPIYGPCDIPEVRDEYLADERLPVQVIRVYFHILCEDDGSNPAVSPDVVERSMQVLNQTFEPYYLQFIHEWRYVNSSEYRELYSWNEWIQMTETYAVEINRYINVFFAYEEDCGRAHYDSWAAYPWWLDHMEPSGSLFLIDIWYDWFGEGNDSHFIHELGHHFGLWHTFHGTDQPYEGTDTCGVCWESPGAGDGDSTGDLCADTEPHPMGSFTCHSPGGIDLCSGNPWDDESWYNIMSYAWPPSCKHGALTLQQGARMRCWINATMPDRIAYTRPFLQYWFSDSDDGDGDMIFEAGETVQLFISLDNLNDFAATDVSVELITNDPSLNITTDLNTFPEIPASSSTDNTASPLEFSIPVQYLPLIDSFYLVINWIQFDDVDTVSFEQVMGGIPILLVDDDLGTSSDTFYTSDLQTMRIPHDIWNHNNLGSPSGTDLNDYRFVIWFTGEPNPNSLEPADLTAISDYLDNGGYLLLTGQGLAGELHADDSAFMADYLHCTYGGVYFEYDVLGQDNSPIGDSLKLRFNLSNWPDESESHELIPYDNGVGEFAFENAAANHYSGISYSGSYRSTFLTFAYETITNYQDYSGNNTRHELLARILQYALGDGSSCIDGDNDGFGDPDNPYNSCPDDNCPLVYNPAQEDPDADDLGSVCDNCSLVYNPDQEDIDFDLIGDLCDDCIDLDGDGYGNPDNPYNSCPDDNCPDIYNPDQYDPDGDALGALCDNCSLVYNPDQEDIDNDSIGDLCDDCIDTDGDGFGNPGYGNVCPDDNCPTDYNPGQEDKDGDGVGDVCIFATTNLDTVETSCTRLMVGNNGRFGITGANMDYSQSEDCANTYMWSGTSILSYRDDAGEELVRHCFVWELNGGIRPAHGIFQEEPTQAFENYEIYKTGPMVTADTAYGLDVTWWAPTDEDYCHFVIQCKRIYKYGSNVTSSLSVGDIIDWEIPMQNDKNSGGYDSNYNLIYQSGGPSDNPSNDCRDNTRRFGAIAMLGSILNNDSIVQTNSYGGYIEPTAPYMITADQLDTVYLYNSMHQPGYFASTEVDDLFSLMVYEGDMTLEIGDTLLVYAAVISLLDGAVDDLRDNVRKARSWAYDYLGVSVFNDGDANGDGGINIGDAVYLINHIFNDGPAPIPNAAGDTNCDETVNIGDAVYLINHIFNNGPEPGKNCK
jgi:hypothetical protein